MNLNVHIRGGYSRKVLCITLLLLIGFSFSAGGAMANSCKGSVDCLNCIAAAHPRIPRLDVEMVQPDCTTNPNGSCGIETGRVAHAFDRVAAVADSGSHFHSGSLSAAIDESDQYYLYRGVLFKSQYPDRGELTPIYLRNDALLC